MTSQAPRVRNLGGAWMDGSGFGSVVRLLPSEGSAGTASGLPHVAVDRLSLLAVGWRLKFLTV